MGRRTCNIPDLFPTSDATGAPNPVVESRDNDPPGAEYDENEVRCSQCNARIENAAAVSSCWLCGGTNFEGEQFREPRCEPDIDPII